MVESYSTYEAKARFSEILRKVRQGNRVLITYRGREVAEIKPIEQEDKSMGEKLQELRDKGILSGRPTRRPPIKPVAKRPGALQRFLEERD